jgi:uncharacterized protein YjiS (DUF1127 family)
MLNSIISRFAPARAGSGQSGWGHLAAAIRRMLRTVTTRQALAELSDHELADIGLHRTTALAEAARLPWDLAPRRIPRSGGPLAAVYRQLEQARMRQMLLGSVPNAVSWGG